jgi:hypothetical protein
VVPKYTCDFGSQLLSLAHKLGAAINSFDYTYDKVGSRKSKTRRDGVHNDSYPRDCRRRAAIAV